MLVVKGKAAKFTQKNYVDFDEYCERTDVDERVRRITQNEINNLLSGNADELMKNEIRRVD